MTDLPKAFLRQMNQLLPSDEFSAFVDTYTKPATRGLRVNSLKITPETFHDIVPFRLQPIPWCPTGFYYALDARPGLHPYHHAGLYYIQEPSAMAVVELLDPQPGERILDLCAAPGGKSTHIADKLNGTGWLVANEIHRKRVKILAENLERWGVKNATILNETPEQLTNHFREYFDKILVDAPCSGEGMFRKNNDAITEWSEHAIAHCVSRQQHILHAAIPMLRPGGRLVYSTCTFNDQENEAVVAQTLAEFHELTLIENVKVPVPFSPAVNKFNEQQSIFRLWPHKLNGEGHFIALFQKKGGSPEKRVIDKSMRRRQRKNRMYSFIKKLPNEWHVFNSETFSSPFEIKHPIAYGHHIYDTSPDLPPLDDLRVVRPGFYVGELKKNRFEPSHALALFSRPDDVNHTLDLSLKDEEKVAAYFRGESLHLDTRRKGWVLVTVDGYAVGWGKQDGKILKNHLPKYMRKP